MLTVLALLMGVDGVDNFSAVDGVESFDSVDAVGNVDAVGRFWMCRYPVM